MNQVTITISGPAMSGKSTIASVIEQALEAHGFTVRNHDPDGGLPEPRTAGVIRRVACGSEVSIEHAMEMA